MEKATHLLTERFFLQAIAGLILILVQYKRRPPRLDQIIATICAILCMIVGARILDIPWNSPWLSLMGAMIIIFLWFPFKSPTTQMLIISFAATILLGLLCAWLYEQSRIQNELEYGFMIGEISGFSTMALSSGFLLVIIEGIQDQLKENVARK